MRYKDKEYLFLNTKIIKKEFLEKNVYSYPLNDYDIYSFLYYDNKIPALLNTLKKHTVLFSTLLCYLQSYIQEDRVYKELIYFLEYFQYFIYSNSHFSDLERVCFPSRKNITPITSFHDVFFLKEKVVRCLPKNYDIYHNSTNGYHNKDMFTKLLKKIFNQLSYELDSVEPSHKYEEVVHEYIEKVLSLIDTFFLIKGIFMEDNEDSLFDISSFCNKVLCKIFYYDLEIIMTIHLRSR